MMTPPSDATNCRRCRAWNRCTFVSGARTVEDADSRRTRREFRPAADATVDLQVYVTIARPPFSFGNFSQKPKLVLDGAMSRSFAFWVVFGSAFIASAIGRLSNPTIFDHAIRHSATYADDITSSARICRSRLQPASFAWRVAP